MPGVRAMLTADELPAPADTVTDLGETIRANPKGERALTNEPVYAGEPVLAVAAVDEETAAAAIEAIHVDFERLPFVVDPLDEPAARRAEPARSKATRGDGRAAQPGPAAGPARHPGDQVDRRRTSPNTTRARLPMGKPQVEWSYGDVEEGFKNAALVLDETFSVANNQHQMLETRSALAYWRNGKLYMHTGTQSAVQTVASIARWLRLDPANVVLITEYTGGGFGSKATGAVTCMIPALLSKKANAPVLMRITREEEQYIGGIRPGGARTRQGRLCQRRPAPRARPVHDRREQRVRGAGRRGERAAASCRSCTSQPRCGRAPSPS